jgi:archaemetzincin
MQGSASIAEGDRQPPYLCPVDLAKILQATGADETERDTALLKFCESHKSISMFAAYAAWIKNRLEGRMMGQ